MVKLFVALMLAVLGASCAFASDVTDVLTVIKQFGDTYNKGDRAAYLAICADEVSIVQDFSPYEWHGAGACAKWWDDLEASNKQDGMTEGKTIQGKVLVTEVTGDRAYVVMSASYTYKMKGKSGKQSGSYLTFSLQKIAAQWRVTGFVWTATKQ